MKVKISQLIESHWGKNNFFITLLLLPASVIFYLLVKIRASLYFYQIIKTQQHPVPIIVIGNIHVGGTGKTPVVCYLAQQLQNLNYHVGIISRGYQRQSSEILLVDPNGSAEIYGDEPLLISQQTKLPVVIGRNRNAAIDFLTNTHPNINVIISDDGLQHYQMKRDLEIVLFPYSDINKTIHLLPHGPLREPLSRLNRAQIVLITNTPPQHDTIKTLQNKLRLSHPLLFGATINYQPLYLLGNRQYTVPAKFFSNKKICAVCAIANPQRFFNALTELQIYPQKNICFPDHAHIELSELVTHYDYIILTEKDAIKLPHSTFDNVFVLPISISIDNNFITSVTQFISPNNRIN